MSSKNIVSVVVMWRTEKQDEQKKGEIPMVWRIMGIKSNKKPSAQKSYFLEFIPLTLTRKHKASLHSKIIKIAAQFCRST